MIELKKLDKYHGCPADRGSADAYYGRAPSPHKYPNGTYNGERVLLTDPDEIKAYYKAYYAQEERKQWY